MVLLRLAPLALALAALLLATPALAGELPLQGHLRTAGGGPAPDGDYNFWVSLYAKPEATEALWSHAYKTVPVSSGLFSLVIGLSPQDALADELVAGPAPLYVGVAIGVDKELPRARVHAVPRASWAAVAAGGTFAWAAATKPGGPAIDLTCTACIEASELADGSVQAKHVAFTYAGSDSKGGPATSALAAAKAKAAEQALVAETALVAESAKLATVAEQAKKADSAATAEELKCTGCIGLAHLAASVAQGFLSTKGGKVDGTLAVTGTLSASGGLDLGTGPISGGRFAGLDLKSAPCNATVLGQVALDSGNKRLHYCDGAAWRRLSSCTGACKSAESTACGQPVADDCGDVGLCAGKGTACSTGEACTAAGCKGLGEAKEAPVASCRILHDQRPALGDGVYWLDPGGGASDDAIQAFCDMKRDGGGWTLIAKIAAGDYSALSDAQYRDLVLNPVDDVAAGKLLDATSPADGVMAFWNRARTNALWKVSTARVVRVDFLAIGGGCANTAIGTYFQKRLSPPADWDLWAALRNTKLWGDGTVVGSDSVGGSGTTFKLTRDSANYDPKTDDFTNACDGTFGFWEMTTHPVKGGGTVESSRHGGLLADGWNNLGCNWLLTLTPADSRWKKDLTNNRGLVWLR
jgi:hypothetical protein